MKEKSEQGGRYGHARTCTWRFRRRTFLNDYTAPFWDFFILRKKRLFWVKHGYPSYPSMVNREKCLDQCPCRCRAVPIAIICHTNARLAHSHADPTPCAFQKIPPKKSRLGRLESHFLLDVTCTTTTTTMSMTAADGKNTRRPGLEFAQHEDGTLVCPLQFLENEQRLLLHPETPFLIRVADEEGVFPPIAVDAVLFQRGGEDF